MEQPPVSSVSHSCISLASVPTGLPLILTDPTQASLISRMVARIAFMRTVFDC